MNFLAHLWIADQTQTSLAGAVCADFVRGSLEHWSEPLRTGMQLHRFIDKTIDQHQAVLALKAQFKPEYRRMAGICLDMAFDYQLAKNWSDYHAQPLAEFSQYCYQSMLASPNLPANFLPTLANMSRYDWLVQYQQRETIAHAYTRIAQRLSKPELLIAASEEVWRLESQIAQGFDGVMFELKSQADQFLQDLTAANREESINAGYSTQD